MTEDRSEAQGLPVRRPASDGPGPVPPRPRPPRREHYPDASPAASFANHAIAATPELICSLAGSLWIANLLKPGPGHLEKSFALRSYAGQIRVLIMGRLEDPEAARDVPPDLYGLEASSDDGSPLDPEFARQLLRDAVALGLLDPVPTWAEAGWDPATDLESFRPSPSGPGAGTHDRALPGQGHFGWLVAGPHDAPRPGAYSRTAKGGR